MNIGLTVSVFCFFFIISEWKVFTHRCTTGTRCSSRTSRTRFTLWRDRGESTAWSVKYRGFSMKHYDMKQRPGKYFFFFFDTHLLAVGTSRTRRTNGTGETLRQKKRKKNGVCRDFFKTCWCNTWENSLFSSDNNKTEEKWESLTREPSLPGAPSGPFSPRSPYSHWNRKTIKYKSQGTDVGIQLRILILFGTHSVSLGSRNASTSSFSRHTLQSGGSLSSSSTSRPDGSLLTEQK